MNQLAQQNINLDAVIAQKMGELTVQNAKLSVLNAAMANEIRALKARIAELEAGEPELPLPREMEKGNGAIAH